MYLAVSFTMSDPHLLLESGPLFAVWKPPGLATQAPAEFPSLEAQMKNWLRRREGKDGNVYLGVPHRLNRPVSGVILFTRHVRAAKRISDQLERRQVEKIYWACVEGEVTPAAGTWTDHLKKIYGKPRTEIVAADDPHGRLAELHYRTLGTVEYPDAATSELRCGTWLEIQLQTGRTHQIRVQAASRGHAVLGDTFYAATSDFGPRPVEDRDRQIALHARSIAILHPATNGPVKVTAPVPEAWLALGLPLSDDAYFPTSC